jgi:cholesterol oxidase
MFTLDTLATTPLEALCAGGYDVWLLDWRGSIALPTPTAPYGCDEVARYDYPAAIQAVLQHTGRSQVDIVAHCVGSITLFMSMLRGLTGVRSIVALQVAAHPIGSTRNEVMAGLHVSEALHRLGVQSLTAYADTHSGWEQKLLDRAMNALALPTAQGRCNSSVCHRTTFMYGSLFVHDQLDGATHDCLHEIFGTASMHMFDQLLACVRRGQIVSAAGDDVYLPHVDRLRLPITFIHGGENAVFSPRATETTFQLLCDRFGSAQYTRHVVPGYGHLDSLLGTRAAQDVYPLILRALDALNP